MRLKKLCTFTMLAALSVGTISSQTVFASTGSTSNPFDTITPAIMVNSEEVALYEQFKNQEEALEAFLVDYEDQIELIQQAFDLEDINVNNAKNYAACVRGIYDVLDEVPQEYADCQVSMEQFFDLFENAEQNDEIMDLVDSLGDSTATIFTFSNNTMDDNEICELNLLLPYTSTIEVDADLVQPCAASGINVTQAISYATTYATSPNTPTYDYYYGVLNGDCTNFLSQILYHSGVSQVVTSSVSSGWWHKRWDLNGSITHEHSNSWIRADAFCKYMGVYGRYSSVSTFSSKLSKGDIIAYDTNGDGDYNHMGFITDSRSYSSTYGNYTYYDFKVAQHTRDYHAWASSDTNNWETLGDSGYIYAIIKK